MYGLSDHLKGMPCTRFSALRQGSSRNSTYMPFSIRSSGMALYLSPVTLLLAFALWLGAPALTLAVAIMVVLRLLVTYFSVVGAAHAARVASWRSLRDLRRIALGMIL